MLERVVYLQRETGKARERGIDREPKGNPSRSVFFLQLRMRIQKETATNIVQMFGYSDSKWHIGHYVLRSNVNLSVSTIRIAEFGETAHTVDAKKVCVLRLLFH